MKMIKETFKSMCFGLGRTAKTAVEGFKEGYNAVDKEYDDVKYTEYSQTHTAHRDEEPSIEFNS